MPQPDYTWLYVVAIVLLAAAGYLFLQNQNPQPPPISSTSPYVGGTYFTHGGGTGGSPSQPSSGGLPTCSSGYSLTSDVNGNLICVPTVGQTNPYAPAAPSPNQPTCPSGYYYSLSGTCYPNPPAGTVILGGGTGCLLGYHFDIDGCAPNNPLVQYEGIIGGSTSPAGQFVNGIWTFGSQIVSAPVNFFNGIKSWIGF